MRKKILILFVAILVMIGNTDVAKASVQYPYYGSGSYVSSATNKPTSGLNFYVDYSAISAFGSGPFSSAFDWNYNYQASVDSIIQYPASATAYPTYFPISGSNSLADDIFGNTLYYNSSGSLINGSMLEPMNSLNIYRCRIELNVNGMFANSTHLEKTIIHEVGHVLLLKHPTSQYLHSVMHKGIPNGSLISSTVTSGDRENIAEKWGI